MKNNFVDREREIKFLEEKLKENKANLIVVYGRRRVGKTYLLTNFFKNKKAIYYLATKEINSKQISGISKKMALCFGDKTLLLNSFTSWEQVFTYLYEKAKNEKVVFIIDEFPYLLESNPVLSSIIQKYWDEMLVNSNIMIVLCGSMISAMEKLLEYKNPLYGRRTGQWKLEPFNFFNFRKFFKNTNIEILIKIYSFTGGIPFYIKEFVGVKNDKEISDFLFKTFFNKGHMFYEEGEILISEELGEKSTYFSIVNAIANGKTKVSEIANASGLKATSINKYLRNLIRLNFIKREVPVTEKEKSKKSIYKMADNFLHFWFKFIYLNKSLVEEEKYEEIKETLNKNFELYVSEKFEEIAKEYIKKNFTFTKIGKQWGKIPKAPKGQNTYEIDICAINEQKKQILFGECKWKNKVNAQSIAKQLDEKTEYVKWHNDERKETLVIFAKSFSKKITQFNNKPVKCYDLRDLEKMLKRKI